MKDIAYVKQRIKKIYYYLSETVKINLPVEKFHTSDFLDLKKNDYVVDRVNYYCKDQSNFLVSENAVKIANFRKMKSFAYYADTKKIVRRFSKKLKFDFLFGDIIYVPDTPSFLKSRPISNKNQNSILLKLNSIRHYQFVEDKIEFENKNELAVWRGHIHQEHRVLLVEKFHTNRLCNIGHCDEKKAFEASFKGFLSKEEQLKYKYIISVEGKDVATNLKWIMSSNSLCFMCKPRYETWFMEGRLKAGFHYVELKDDFSDLEEKISFYNKNPDKALEIIKNAQTYTKQFLDENMEEIIGLLVAEKYFIQSQQLKK
ncbi:glycosyl transferase family 90 [Marinomonas sp. PE14-40]|uniref:glycosyl transferase family 90 n=1 Tax=Marinomonas sp. PE14-40 TaxID=3060621 RepID=UPI003F672A49